jgi:hypothetical protein
MAHLIALLFLIFQLVTPAGDLLPGQAFTVTLESIAPATLDIPPAFDILSAPGGAVEGRTVSYAGGGVLAIRLRVRMAAAPGVVTFTAYSEGRTSSRAVVVCCVEARAPAMGWRIMMPTILR